MTITPLWNRCIRFTRPDGIAFDVKVQGDDQAARENRNALVAALAAAGLTVVEPPKGAKP